MQVANPLISSISSSLSDVVVDGITKLGSTIGGSQGSSQRLYTSSGDEVERDKGIV